MTDSKKKKRDEKAKAKSSVKKNLLKTPSHEQNLRLLADSDMEFAYH